MNDPEKLPQPESGAQPAARRHSRIYHGWFVVAAAMIISAAAMGVSDSFSAIPWSRDFAWSSFQLGIVFSIGTLMSGFTQPVLGHLFDRFNSRRVILISIAVAGFATVSLSWVAAWQALVFLYSFVFSTAIGGASFAILGPLTARWFLKRRTLVLALLLVSPTVGSIFLNPFTDYLIGSVLYGWQLALLVLGTILLFLALPVGLIFLRNWPSDMGLKADGEPESPVEASMRGSAPAIPRGRFEVVSWRRAFRSPPILVLLPTLAIGGFASSFVSLFLLSFAIESVNITFAEAAFVHPVMSVLGVIGALACWWAAERFPRKKVLGAAFLAQGVALVVLIAVPTPVGLWTFAVLAGLSGTAWMLVAFLLIADIYGLRALATLWGFAFLFHSLGSVIGPTVGGLAIDITGSYVLPIAACASMVTLVSIMVFAVDERKYSARYQAAIGSETAEN